MTKRKKRRDGCMLLQLDRSESRLTYINVSRGSRAWDC
jgi:hypothetical protein